MKSEVFSITDLFTLMSIFISSFDEKYKYIARDEDGAVYLYIDKPFKDGTVWKTKPRQKRSKIEGINEHAFNSVKWTDEEPTAIPDENEIEKMIDKELMVMKKNSGKKIVVRRMKNEK